MSWRWCSPRKECRIHTHKYSNTRRIQCTMTLSRQCINYSQMKDLLHDTTLLHKLQWLQQLGLKKTGLFFSQDRFSHAGVFNWQGGFNISIHSSAVKFLSQSVINRKGTCDIRNNNANENLNTGTEMRKYIIGAIFKYLDHKIVSIKSN